MHAFSISELDVQQATALLATTQSQLPVLETGLRQAIYQLGVLLGRPPGALLGNYALAIHRGLE